MTATDLPTENRSNSGGFLHVDGLKKRFGEMTAVDSVDLTVNEGEFLTLLGPSGCGKTTLLRMIGGFEKPTAGRISLRGTDLTSAPPEHRPFNTVFQSYALFPHMSVAENVGYGPRTAGKSSRDISQSVSEALELVHLQSFSNRAVHEMSGGQQQRVALARALVNKPQVLLLDEPLGALDLQLRKVLQDELRLIQRELGTTFIFVTHDQDEALKLSHRIAVMEAGRIVQLDDPRGLYDRPATQFVANFVGETNLIECETTGGTGETVDVKIEGAGVFGLSRRRSDELAKGTRVHAVLRPEHLTLTRNLDGMFTGVVKEQVFLGTHSRVEVELASGTVLRVNVVDATTVTRGDNVAVNIKPGTGSVVR